MNDTHRRRISDLALDADEAGDTITCLALMHVLKLADLPSAVARRAM